MRAPLGDQEALPLGPVFALEADLPGLGRGERDPIEGLEPHAQLAASPATVAGSPSHDPIGDNGSLTLEDATAGIAVEGQTGLRDEALSEDSRFLYAVDADSRRVFGWAVAADGSLSPLGSWDGLPTTAAGLAAS